MDDNLGYIVIFVCLFCGRFLHIFFQCARKMNRMPCLALPAKVTGGTEVRNQTKFINNYKEAAKYIKILIVIVLFFFNRGATDTAKDIQEQ